MTEPQNPYIPNGNGSNGPQPVAGGHTSQQAPVPNAQPTSQQQAQPQQSAQSEQGQPFGQQATQTQEGQPTQSSYASQPQQPQQSQQSRHVPSYAAQQDYAIPSGANGRPLIGAAFGAGRNIWGVLAFGAAVLLLLVSIIFSLLYPILLRVDGGGSFQALSMLHQALTTLLALGALGFGIAGLLARNPSKWPAVVGTAIGAFAVIQSIFSLVSNAMYSLF